MKFLKILPARFALLFLFIAASASAQQEAPDALVKRISQEILDLAKTDQQIQAGNQQRIMEVVLVYRKISTLAIAKPNHW